MKHIKLFENFDNKSIAEICKELGIENYTINDDGTVDVDGEVDLSHVNLDTLPLKFGKVNGSFDCSDNYLTSLEGAPNHVEFDFDCSDNHLISLEGSPKYIGNAFDCSTNFLHDLYGSPEHVGSYFNCRDNNLTTLKGLITILGDNSQLDIESNLHVLYDILKDDIECVEKFYDFNIITEFENKKRPLLNLKRLNKFIKLYNLSELSEEQLDELKLFYNIV